MALKTESREIDGLNVQVTQFAGRKNLDLLVDLAAFIGPALAAARPKSEGDSLLDADLDVGGIVNALMANMSKDRVSGLVMRMLDATHINERGAVEQFDTVFAGADIWRLPKVLIFVVEVNFGNFSKLAASVSGLRGQ